MTYAAAAPSNVSNQTQALAALTVSAHRNAGFGKRGYFASDAQFAVVALIGGWNVAEAWTNDPSADCFAAVERMGKSFIRDAYPAA